jgi:hypothetical protein
MSILAASTSSDLGPSVHTVDQGLQLVHSGLPFVIALAEPAPGSLHGRLLIFGAISMTNPRFNSMAGSTAKALATSSDELLA